MTNLERLKEYASEFSKEVEKECLIQVKKMRKKGFSYEWITEAITHKKQEEWEKWGFGLLHSDNYQRQITNLINKKKEQDSEIDISNLAWDSFEQEEEKEERNSNKVSEIKSIEAITNEISNQTKEIKESFYIENDLYKQIKKMVEEKKQCI